MKTAYFALSVKQLDAFSGGGVSYGVVVTLFIITHGVEGRRRRGPGCWRRHAGQWWGRVQDDGCIDGHSLCVTTTKL
jgi:hypothetical protein